MSDMERTPDNPDIAESVENLVPTRLAYSCAWISLVLSTMAGGFIGYACMRVFFPSISSAGQAIGTILVTIAISYAMSIMTSLGLQASVEWKARKVHGPAAKRPSRFV